jgi:iron(II)-dependent oxidoreductase
LRRAAAVLVAALAASLYAFAVSAQEDMVKVPMGTFRMGSDAGEPDERPAHDVRLEAFTVDRVPVTNSQFARFLNAAGLRGARGERLFDDDDPDALIHRKADGWAADAGHESRPAIEVSWHGARAYCAWRGARLPTEAEWEKAARGSYGMQHGAARVWQWVSSAYRPYPWRADDGREDPDQDAARGTRGGSLQGAAASVTQRGLSVSRNPRAGHHNIGFRCAK